MRDRQTCIECGKQSPETDTNYTLISAQFGWRLTRKRHADGTFVVEWRCPDCWRAFKNTKAAQEPAVGWPSSAHEPAPSSRAFGAPPSSGSVHPPRTPSSRPAPASGPGAVPRPRPSADKAPSSAASAGTPPRPPVKPSR